MTPQGEPAHRGDGALVGPMRVLLGVAAVLVFLAGLPLVVFPSRTAEWFAWTIDAGMTAGFLGAGYWASAVLEVAGARSATWERARLAVWAVLAFTVLTLVVTLVHRDKFHLGAGQPDGARWIAWGWLAVYAVVPLAMAVILVVQGRGRGTAGLQVVRTALPVPLRVLLAALALVLVGTGIVLLVSPGTVVPSWPWPLTPLTARAIGAWLVGLGWAAGHAALIDDVGSVRPLGWTGVTFVLLQALALVRFGDTTSWAAPLAWSYVAVLAVVHVVSCWILVLRPSRSRPPR